MIRLYHWLLLNICYEANHRAEHPHPHHQLLSQVSSQLFLQHTGHRETFGVFLHQVLRGLVPLNTLRSLELLQSNLVMSLQHWPHGQDSIWRHLYSATWDVEGWCCGFRGPVNLYMVGLRGDIAWSLVCHWYILKSLITFLFDILHHRISIISGVGFVICEIRL